MSVSLGSAITEPISTAVNEISEVMQVLDRPLKTVTETVKKGKKETITTYSISKLDIILTFFSALAIIQYARGVWKPGMYLNELGEWVQAQIPDLGLPEFGETLESVNYAAAGWLIGGIPGALGLQGLVESLGEWNPGEWINPTTWTGEPRQKKKKGKKGWHWYWESE